MLVTIADEGLRTRALTKPSPGLGDSASLVLGMLVAIAHQSLRASVLKASQSVDREITIPLRVAPSRRGAREAAHPQIAIDCYRVVEGTEFVEARQISHRNRLAQLENAHRLVSYQTLIPIDHLPGQSDCTVQTAPHY